MAQNLTEDLNIVANSNLKIELLDGDLNIIQKLDDEPNDVGGLTSAELKAKFDEAGNVIKTYINDTLIPAILAEDATEEARASAEAARETAEQARASAEEERASAEAARVEAENGRVSAEAARVTAEQERASAEQARADENTGIVAQATAQAEAAEAAKKSAESAATSALSYKSAAYSSAVLAGQERGAAEQAKINAEAAQGKAEAAKEASEAAKAAAESAKDAAIQAQISAESADASAQSSAGAASAHRTAAEAAKEAAENAKDSAKGSAALAMGYAIGTVSNPFEFSVPANGSEDYVVLADPDSPAIVEDGKKYRITVNREIAYATASGGSISALGVTITAGSSSYHVGNQNGYDITGSFGEAATQTIGKSAAEYADEASRAAELASSAETTATEQAALAMASETAAKVSETAAAASAAAAAASAARAEEVVGGDYATKTDLSAHTGNADVHVTPEEKAAWNERDVFIATYGTTTNAEISAACDAGKVVLCKKDGDTRIARLLLDNGVVHMFDAALYNSYTIWMCSRGNWSELTYYYTPSSHASTHARGGSDPITPASIGAAPASKYVTITLSASGWDSTAKTQTVTVTGVSATETAQLITPVPALASQTSYYDAGIKCTGQAANSLTFTADTVPTADLTVYVTIQEVSA